MNGGLATISRGRASTGGVWAAELIESAVDGTVTQHDDGSTDAMHDLEIRYRDGSVAAVEVTAAVDPDATVLWNLMNGDGRWIEPDLVAAGWSSSGCPHVQGGSEPNSQDSFGRWSAMAFQRSTSEGRDRAINDCSSRPPSGSSVCTSRAPTSRGASTSPSSCRRSAAVASSRITATHWRRGSAAMGRTCDRSDRHA